MLAGCSCQQRRSTGSYVLGGHLCPRRIRTTTRHRGDPDCPDAPGFILQRAASGLLRYGLPDYVPMQPVPGRPLLPRDRRLCIPLVHADDGAEAISRVIDKRAAGPFNLAAEPPIRRDDVASALGARPVHIPSSVLAALGDLSLRARLQHVDRGLRLARPGIHRASTGLLPSARRAQLRNGPRRTP